MGGVGYTTIFQLGKKKFELSAGESVMRHTIWQGKKRTEVLYFRVEKTEEIRKIERLSERWVKNKSHDYFVMEQRDAKNKLTGYFKIVKRKNASVSGKDKASDADWMYYARRTNA